MTSATSTSTEIDVADELSDDGVRALVDALLAQCAEPVADSPEEPMAKPTPASEPASFERRPGWMSQVGRRRAP